MIKKPVKLDDQINICDADGVVLVPTCWLEASDHKARQKAIAEEIVELINGNDKGEIKPCSGVPVEVPEPILEPKKRGRPLGWRKVK